MAALQRHLIQKKLDEELPERIAERELQDAKAKLEEDKRDIEIVEKWHLSTIASRILNCRADAFQAEVLLFDMKSQQDQEVARILDAKESLVKNWYEQKHGFNEVRFRYNQRGTMRYMQFGFYSTDLEVEVRAQLLKGRKDFEAELRVALYILRDKFQLPKSTVRIINDFIPDYVEHLAQEKMRVQNMLPWL